MTEQEAVNLAHLWRAGKLIGGDPYDVCDVLLGMLYKLDATQSALEKIKSNANCRHEVEAQLGEDIWKPLKVN